MGWVDVWLPNTIAALDALRGTGAVGANGVANPMLNGVDTIGVLGLMSPAVVQACKSFQQSTGITNPRALNCTGDAAAAVASGDGSTPVISDDGFVSDPAPLDALANGSITIESYVAGYALAGSAHKRSNTVDMVDTYEIWGEVSTIQGNETQLMSFVRQMLEDWNRAVVASSQAIGACGTNVASLVPDDELDQFWGAIQSLCADLDVLAENPPATLQQDIAGATKAALTASGSFVGKAAGELANEAGVLAGDIGKGFISSANFLTLAIAGIAVFAYLK